MTADKSNSAAPATRYELLRPLGAGAVGVLYVALDRATGERVALKKLSRINPISVLRFKREFRALADIHHPNLVKLYELERADDGWFLTMELVEGVELLRGLELTLPQNEDAPVDVTLQNDRPQISKVRDAFSQLALGIHAIHQAGMLHRDLKPSNVMLSTQGRVVVLDFGLVRELAPANIVSLEGNIAGTPAYMPPEQALGEELGEASDWYAFGVMLYEALSGCLPFDGLSPVDVFQRKLNLEAPALSPRDGPRALRELCARLLKRDPRERPNAKEILDALGDAELPPGTEEQAALGAEPHTVRTGAELLGRDAELVQLEAAFESCIRNGTLVAAHIRGPSGAGKTALVHSFATDASRLAAPLVVRSRCYVREAMPFKSIDGAVDALATHLMSLDDFQLAQVLPADLAALTALFPVLERVPLVRREIKTIGRAQGDAVLLRKRAEDGFRYLLRGLAAIRPLVIWIDDLQWGDLDSTQLLQDWLKRPIQAPVLLLFTYRGDEIATNACLSALVSPAAKGSQAAEQFEIELQPLKDSAVHALCSTRIGESTSLAPNVVARIVRDARGNPFLATQLAALARTKLARGETDLTEFALRKLVLHTTTLLPAPAQQLLRVLAVAGRPLTPRIALAAADVAHARGGDIHELQALQLVRTRYVGGQTSLEIYHESVRESVHAALTEAERKHINAALLRVLQRESRVEPAWLHELALGAGRNHEALQYGLRAAETASQNLAFERASELYERCVRLMDAEPNTALWEQLALAHVHCGRGVDAANAYLKASEHAPRAERVVFLQRAASHLLRSGWFDEGEHLVQQVFAALEIRLPTTNAGLYAAIGWERARIAVLERVVRPRDDVTIPPEMLRLGVLYGVLSLDTQCHAPLRAALFQSRATRICFQYGESQTTARAYCMNAVIASMSADASAARRVHAMLERADALVDRDGHPEALLELYCARATSAMFLGELREVIDASHAADDLYASKSAGGELGDYFYMFVVRSSRVSALQFLGRHIEAADELQRLLELAAATSNRSAVLQATMVRAGVEQAQNCCRDTRARLDLERTELPATTGALHLLHMLAVMRTACMTGDYDWATALYTDFKPKLDASPLRHNAYLMHLMRANHARLLLNHHVASGSTDDPEPLVREHLRWIPRKSPQPFRKAAPLRIRARLALLKGDRDAAAALLEASRRAVEEIGARDDAERDRYALGLLRGGVEGAQLTAAAIAALREMGVQDPERELLGHFPELKPRQ